MTETKRDEGVGERLARLSNATSSIAPPSGLAARMSAAALAPRKAPGSAIVLPFARAAIIAGTLAAAAAVVLAFNVDQNLEDSVMQAVGVEEVDL